LIKEKLLREREDQLALDQAAARARSTASEVRGAELVNAIAASRANAEAKLAQVQLALEESARDGRERAAAELRDAQARADALLAQATAQAAKLVAEARMQSREVIAKAAKIARKSQEMAALAKGAARFEANRNAEGALELERQKTTWLKLLDEVGLDPVEQRALLARHGLKR